MKESVDWVRSRRQVWYMLAVFLQHYK